MSGKLDKPLDDIVTAQRRKSGGRNLRGRPTGGRPAPAAPAGGVKKNSAKPARTPASRATHMSGDSKAIVSNLPKDVSEEQIKEYLSGAVGSIKRVDLVYGPNSQSRGIANVIFSKPDGAGKALQKLNGLLVDGQPIRIEIVVGAAHADRIMPPVKSLAERTTQPKVHPRSAAGKKQPSSSNKGNPPKRNATQGGDKKRHGRNARPTKKTAEELDSEMADYFDNAPNGTTGNASAPAAAAPNGDAAMEDEIM